MKKATLAIGIGLVTLCSQPTFAADNTLSKTESQHLTLMREEEKLARDVYLTLGEKYQIRTFSNIANAESRHYSVLLPLLQYYQITDPVNDDKIGVFTDPKMQSLYQQLIEKGGDNLLSALQVGAEIEELDIADLMKAQKETDNEDINRVYNNLTRGSRNHLRAFIRQIKQQGGDYQPKHISPELFAEIINSPQERGQHQGQGQGQGKQHRGQGRGQAQRGQ